VEHRAYPILIPATKLAVTYRARLLRISSYHLCETDEPVQRHRDSRQLCVRMGNPYRTPFHALQDARPARSHGLSAVAIIERCSGADTEWSRRVAERDCERRYRVIRARSLVSDWRRCQVRSGQVDDHGERLSDLRQ